MSGYVSRSLGESEHIRYNAGHHWLVWLGASVLVLPSIAILAASYPYSAIDYVGLILSLTLLPFGLFHLVRLASTEIAVTNERIVRKRGLVSFSTEELELDTVETISVSQSIAGRLLGFGTLLVRGTGSEHIEMHMVDQPVRLRREIQLAREEPWQPLALMSA